MSAGSGRTRLRTTAGLGATLLLLPALAACGSSSDDGTAAGSSQTLSAPQDSATSTGTDLALEPGSTALGYPDVLAGTELDASASAGLAWTDEAGLLYVITLGSSTCPTVAEPEATASGDGVLVTFVPIAADTACTADLVASTTVVGLPDGLGEDTDLVVELDGIGSATIPARSVAGTEALVPVTAG
ncbi:MAG TPA: hypothetical protein VGC67_14345 [Cellulomonas sp.]